MGMVDNNQARIATALFWLRASVFLVMLVWTLDKFLDPEHAARVYKHFYFIGGLSKEAFYVIGLVELVILIGFLVGYRKKWTYGFVLVVHAISTLSSYKKYTVDIGLLFFAAWPMLAACFALYYLRDLDTKYTIGN